LEGSNSVEGLCSGCLLSVGLAKAEDDDEATPLRLSVTPSMRDDRHTDPRPSSAPAATDHGLLHPFRGGLVAPHWAMPAELLQQAARRVRDVAAGLGTAFAVSIVLNNLLDAFDWYHFAHPALKNALAGGTAAASFLVALVAHVRPLAPRGLLLLSLGYEVFVATAISVSDHLEPLPADVPLANISWLCVWIVIFPLVVTAPPRAAFFASFAAASTWPLAYFVGRALGNPAVPVPLLLLNAAEGYLAVALAVVTSFVVRHLQELGCYHLEKRLDHGGMGEIWRARHHLLARPVAVKVIRPELIGVKTPAEQAGLVSRFRREAEATAALHSPHTVGLYDFGVTPEGVFYYVMELLNGVDLDTLVRRYGPVPPERAIHLLMQACESLADAHGAGLIHRDVKPANLVTCHWGLKYDFLKVLDFGLVKATWSIGDDDRLTSDNVIAGTPAYIAPEVALGGRVLDARVDLYGLGCVAYWLLTGEKVFTGATPMEVVLNHVKTPPIPPSQRAGRPLPEDLERLVLSCLAKEPSDRPPSAEWLADRLAECRSDSAWTPGRAREWWERNVAPRPI
jgi:serine/threonine-protein kinase